MTKRGLRLALALVAVAASGLAFAGTADAARLTVILQGSLTANGAGWGTVVETTEAQRIDCTYPSSTSCQADYGFGWVVQLEASAPPGWRFSHWTEGGSGQVSCDDGLAADVCRFQMWFADLSVRAHFVDETPPDATIDSGPSGPIGHNSPSWTFSSPDHDPANPVTFVCRWQDQVRAVTYNYACNDGSFNPSGFWDGGYVLTVIARDGSGNQDPSPPSRSITIDTTPPDTSFVAGPPAGTVTHVGGHFYYASTEAGSTFQYRRDGGAWQPSGFNNIAHVYCTGRHTFEVRAVDAAGNVDPTPASRTWTVFLVDLNGNCRSDVGVFRPSDGTWRVQGMATVWFGQSGDVPVPGDYDADSDVDIAVYRPSNGGWFVQGSAPVFHGQSGDLPVPADYDGDGKTDIAVWRPSTGAWLVRGLPTVYYGRSGDVPVPQDYDYDGDFDRAVWRPSVGGWFVHGRTTVYWGRTGDVPVPGHFNRRFVQEPPDLGVWRPGSGAWLLRNEFVSLKLETFYWGLSGDVPIAGEFNGGGNGDLAVFRPSNGTWYMRNVGTVAWGQSGDIPLR
jgi:hypothetical protein